MSHYLAAGDGGPRVPGSLSAANIGHVTGRHVTPCGGPHTFAGSLVHKILSLLSLSLQKHNIDHPANFTKFPYFKGYLNILWFSKDIDILNSSLYILAHYSETLLTGKTLTGCTETEGRHLCSRPFVREGRKTYNLHSMENVKCTQNVKCK